MGALKPLTKAVREQIPNLATDGEMETSARPAGRGGSQRSGRWIRRGNTIVLLGV